MKKELSRWRNSGPNTNGSQFFIMHVDYPLPPAYAKFGRVTEGQDVVDAIAETETNHKDKPGRAGRDEPGLYRRLMRAVLATRLACKGHGRG
jgi:cyclophilin family peptidyl-prolyl cis-trans isomerase